MTDINKDKMTQEDFSGMSFKEKILADLAAATQERQRQREQWLQQDNKVATTTTEEITPTVGDEDTGEIVGSMQDSVHVSESLEEFKSDLEEALERVENLSQVTDSLTENQKSSAFQGEEEKSAFANLSEETSLTPNHLVSQDETPSNEQATENFEEFKSDLEQVLKEVEELSQAADFGIDTSTRTEFVQEEQKPDSVLTDVVEEVPEKVDSDLEITKEIEVLSKEHELPSYDDLSVWQNDSKAPLAREEVLEDIEEAGVEKMSRESRKKANRLAAKISTVFISLLVLAILAGGFFTYRYVTSAIAPLDSSATEYIQVEIPSGSGNKLIGKILEENGVIKDATVFNFYTKFKNYSNFQSGYYNFKKSMSLDDIAKELQKGGTPEPQLPVLGKIVIPEGYTLKQIAEAVTLNADTEDTTDKTPYTSEEFMATVQDKAFIAEMVQKYPNLLGSLPEASAVKYRLEGYLFPATYDYYEETTIKDIVDQMLAAMDDNLVPYYASISDNGMTVNQTLTLASLVEKEGETDDDREMIASVFYNRWNTGMPLQSNIAILYAMDKLGEKTTLAEDAAIDTSIDSPYNIYLNTGLMPGPVDSPGLSAIKAIINPANTKYYYFVADVTTGDVYFAEGYEEHSANVEKYVNSKLTN